MKYVVPNPWEEEYELLDDFIKFPLDTKYVDSNHWEEEFEENTKDEDLSKIPFDPWWITKNNGGDECKDKDPATIDEKDVKEDNQEDEE